MDISSDGPNPRAGRIIGAVLLCGIAGAAYVGLAGAVFGAGFAVSIAGPPAILFGAMMGLRAGLFCGLVAGLTYGMLGSPLGVAMACLFGGAANPMLRDFAGFHPVGLSDLYDLFMRMALPFLVSGVFAWLLFRAGDEDSALPMLNGAAEFLTGSSLHRVPLVLRFVVALALGTLGAWLFSSQVGSVWP